MPQIFEYFVVCGIGPDIRTLDGSRGYHGTSTVYLPSVLDQYPASNNSLYPPPPPQLPTCILPAGIQFYSSGYDSNDASTFPRSYPIVLTEGDGSKIYVSCIAFRDPVCQDICEAYRIPGHTFADKCICLVSRSPSFRTLREALEEIFKLCFSATGSSKPLWEVVSFLVSNVPLPIPGKDRVLFSIENSLLSVEVPPKETLPHADISQFLDSQGFLDYLERGPGSERNSKNLLDKLQDAIGRGQDPRSILPSYAEEHEIVTVSDPSVGVAGIKYHYDRFPSLPRTEEQEEKRQQVLAAATGVLEYSGASGLSSPSALSGKDAKAESLSPRERAAERERMVLDIKVKLQGLWLRLLKLETTDDPLSSFEYGTILALIESDAEGIGGSGFVECIREHINSGLSCQLTEEQFIAVKELAGLGLPDSDAWYMIETIAGKNNIGYKQIIKLRGYLSHIRQTCVGYWGIHGGKSQAVSFGLPSPRSQSASNNQQGSEVSGVGRSWVQSMFSRDSSFSRVGSLNKKDVTAVAQKKLQTNMRILRGHTGSVTALHCVTKKEVWDLVGDREDAGLFLSGSTDCTVKIWDPSLRGSELRATLKGHTRTVRAISSDRAKVVSGSDDQSVLVWDKQTTQLLEELKGHDAQVSIVRMLSGERVLTAGHDGTVKMWDVRTDTCVATVGCCSSAILCMEYDDSTGILAAGGRDSTAHLWDIRAGRQMHKLSGHSKWIRSIRMAGDTLITGSDDWTARIWSVSQGTCDAVLACHDGPVLCVEHSPTDRGVVTGSIDGLLRFWENDDGSMRCTKNVTMHNAPILSINAGEQWLAIGAADNSMSLFHWPQERLGGGLSASGSKMSGWQLYRTPQKTIATVRCIASDLERKRICSGGRNGMIRRL
ncbi:hypothetical protein M569_10454 [Genlisea aurea]|uniref:UDENN domain-containing protein n=1 Tax=Genlisea aurea TaxID=192259 RepID=S8DWM6_9LAMI|nr:hypothetical protein M569_10454 [Genlisea aurea]